MDSPTSPTATENTHCVVELDVAVIGGGIAGLWLINRLQNDGYECALFESRALGSDQSVASQGMIHGGIKYTLSGALSGASEAIADMPAHWQDCLAGCGDVDLRGANVLSNHFYMWSTASVTSKLTTFFASKATRGRVEKVKTDQRPAVFQHPQFSGQLYRLVDMVLDVPSVLRTLANNVQGRTFLLPPEQAQWQTDDQGQCYLVIHTDQQSITVRAKQFIFAAGKGNAALLEQLNETSPAMQTRPLHQVMVKFNGAQQFYGHCLGTDKTPKLTISTHPCRDGKWVWYLGGSLAEKGVDKSPQQLIHEAQKELQQLMPWLDLADAEWATLPVDRAEPRQKNFVRPDKAYIGKGDRCRNLSVAWPTKLTLSPNLANEALALLHQQGISPSDRQVDLSALNELPQATVAESPWDSVEFTRL